MFVNISRYHHKKWNEAQLGLAKELGSDEVVTLMPPALQTDASPRDVRNASRGLVDKVQELVDPDSAVIYVQGEPGLTYKLVTRLLSFKYRVVYAVLDTSGKTPKFVSFREF